MNNLPRWITGAAGALLGLFGLGLAAGTDEPGLYGAGLALFLFCVLLGFSLIKDAFDDG